MVDRSGNISDGCADGSSSSLRGSNDELTDSSRGVAGNEVTGERPDAVGAEVDRPSSSQISLPEQSGKRGSSSAARGAFISIESQQTVISTRPPVATPDLLRAPNPLEMGRALEGERLGHFQLEEFVGGGGMGAVFRAIDTMLGRTVAVKVVASDHTDEDMLRRFRNEAQSAARLDHPNIARVYYVGEDKGWNYIVFEYIEGVNVRDLVEHKGPLPLDEAIAYTLQIAEALQHAAERDVVHRDIKPSNVLVMSNGQAKLVDMGLARLHQVESSSQDLTASGVTLGTFDYISPEQARDPRNTDVRSDLYSLGCTFYFMLTGLPPFPEGTVLQKLLSHTSDAPPDPRDFRPDLPEEITTVVNKMLAKHPSQRYQQPSELIGELLVVADELDLAVAQRGGTIWITPSHAPPTFWERHLPWAVPTLTLVAAVLLLDWLTQSPGNETLSPPNIFPVVAGSASGAVPPAGNGSANGDQGEVPARPDSLPPRDDSSTGVVGDEPGAGGSPGDSANVVSVVPLSPLIGLAPFESLLDDERSWPGDDELRLEAVLAESGSATLAAGEAAGLTVVESGPGVRPAQRPATAEAAKRLIVGVPASVPPDAVVVGSFDEALRIARESPAVESIELWFSGPQWIEPREITLLRASDQSSSKLEHRQLTISRGGTHWPILACRPDPQQLAPGEVNVLRLVGGRIAWKGVHFRFELPLDHHVRRESWALFKLDRVESLALTDCTLTIKNAYDSGSAFHGDVAFFELFIPPMLDMAAGGLTTPQITLANSIARGQATLVRAEHVVPFRLSWQQGLFVSTERLLDVGGAIFKPEGDKIRLELDHVTAVAPLGLCRMQLDEGTYQLGLYVHSTNCIFDELDSNAPLVLHQGVKSVDEARKLFELDGENNFYPDAAIRWRIETSDSVEEFRFDPPDEDWKWYQEVGADTNFIMWDPVRRVDRAVHLRTPDDYLLDRTIPQSAGFDINQLPILRDPEPATSAPSTAVDPENAVPPAGTR